MLARCLQLADKQRRVAACGYDSHLIRVEGLLKLATRYWFVLHVQATEDGEQNPPDMLAYECGYVTQACCMNVVTVIQEVREGTDLVRGSLSGANGSRPSQSQ